MTRALSAFYGLLLAVVGTALVIYWFALQSERRVLDFQVVDTSITGDCSDGPPVGLEVPAPGTYELQHQQVDSANLGGAVASVFGNRPNKLLVVDVGPTVTYGEMIHAVAEARGAGAKVFVLGHAGRCAPAVQFEI